MKNQYDNKFGKLPSLVRRRDNENKPSRELREGDFVSLNDKVWEVFAITGSGMVTLQNSELGGVPASLVVPPTQVHKLIPLMKSFVS